MGNYSVTFLHWYVSLARSMVSVIVHCFQTQNCELLWDLRRFCISIDFSVWVDSPFPIEYIGESFNRKCQSQVEL